jgi:hypothetical protein
VYVTFRDRSGGEEGGAIAADDGTRYSLSLPEESGEFHKFEDTGEEPPTEEEIRRLGLRDVESGSAEYRNMDPTAGGDTRWEPGTISLRVAGFWGEVEDPERAVDEMFALAAEGFEEAGEEEGIEIGMMSSSSDFTDSEVVLKCQLVRGDEEDSNLGYALEYPLCVWADYSTLGLVDVVSLPDLPPGFDINSDETPQIEAPEPVSLDDAAEYARQLRTDSIQPS